MVAAWGVLAFDLPADHQNIGRIVGETGGDCGDSLCRFAAHGVCCHEGISPIKAAALEYRDTNVRAGTSRSWMACCRGRPAGRGRRAEFPEAAMLNA
jgi:hypothetical protein